MSRFASQSPDGGRWESLSDKNCDNGIIPLSLRPEAAAKSLGISKRLLWAKTNAGEIPCVRIGRAVVYPVESLRAWLAEQATASSAKVRSP